VVAGVASRSALFNCQTACSPDGAERNPGIQIADPAPDFASLYPGYIKTRVITRSFGPERGKPVVIVLEPSKGRAERLSVELRSQPDVLEVKESTSEDHHHGRSLHACAPHATD
jgi:hypothetical protein